jgi:Mg2+ and Co2+ transporter CorA
MGLVAALIALLCGAVLNGLRNDVKALGEKVDEIRDTVGDGNTRQAETRERLRGVETRLTMTERAIAAAHGRLDSIRAPSARLRSPEPDESSS